MPPTTKNLGLVKAIHVGLSAPSNIAMIWYDDNTGVKKHKYYDVVLGQWVLLGGSSTSLVYSSLITQSSTSAPFTVNVIDELPGVSIDYVYDSVGSYTGTVSGADLTENETLFFIQSPIYGWATAYWYGGNTFKIETRELFTNNSSDDILNGASLMMKIKV